MAAGVPAPDTVSTAAIGSVPARIVTYRRQKRALDVIGSASLILVLSPLILLTAILIKLTSRGPLFYISKRVGICGRVFKFYKFRSMHSGAENKKLDLQGENEKDGPVFKIKNDPRTTAIGRFIRKTSIDELPQLYNVLIGDMSLVGPRPAIISEVQEYSPYDMERLGIRPGLTCYWQIMGRSDLSFEEWMALDHKYMTEMSLWEDIKILCKTPWAVISCRGAY
jgi:lipopolysaccharide/colanic/teichoic acid biosynthesis glycosyltransferase